MKTYFSFFKLRLNVALQYRFAAIAGIATQFFWGAMLLMIYEAYYKADISIPLDWNMLTSYVWLGQSFFYLTRFNCADTDISESIISGNVSYEFIRPLNIYFVWFSKLLANKIAGTALRFLPILCVAILLPSEYRIGLPASLLSFVLFLVSMILGTFLTVGTGMLIYVIMFYTTSSKGLFNVYAVIAEFFAGSVIPIPFMPETLQKICYILPFRLSFDLPYRVYCGNISVAEGAVSVIIQLFWIIVITLLGNYMLSKISKKLVIQGG